LRKELQAGSCNAFPGKIVLPASYPLRPPDIYLLTPSGRFAINQKICLSITGYHEESWSPAWQLQQALVALAAYFEEDVSSRFGQTMAAHISM
jgi:ubiquitin-conjugating enzyme E2 J1